MTCLQLLVLVQLFLWRHYLCQVPRPPEMEYPSHEEILYYRDTEQVLIKCTIKGDTYGTHNEFKWTQNGTVIESDWIMNVDKDTGVLNIQAFSWRFEATYRCIVSRTFEDGTASDSVVSAVSPAIYLRRCWIERFGRPGVVKVRPVPFEFYSMECGDRGMSIGPITYEWFDATTNMPADDGQRIYVNLEGTIFFNEIRAEDRNKYLICRISADLRGVQYSERGTLIWLSFYVVGLPPSLTPAHRYSSKLVVARRQSDATLECVFSHYGSKYPYKKYVYWYLSSGKQIMDSVKYDLQYVGRRLTIRNVTEDDQMNYTCQVHDYNGSPSAQVFLNVTSEPVFTHGPPGSRTVIQGEDTDFNCEAVSVLGAETPAPVVWYINAAKIQSSYDTTKFQLSQNDTVLTVRDAQKSTDIMCVQCEVANNVGTAFANACLNVLLPMIIVTKPPAYQMVADGDVVNLTVRAEAEPTVELHYRWECGFVSFNLNTAPKYVISNLQTMEVYINTSLLPEDRLEDIAGHYNIVIYNEYETNVVGTEVVFIVSNTTRPTTKANEETTSRSDQVTLPENDLTRTNVSEQASAFNTTTIVVTVGILFLLVLLVLGATVCTLKQMNSTGEGVTPRPQEATLSQEATLPQKATLPQDDVAPITSCNAGEQAAAFNPSTVIIAPALLFLLVLLVLVATVCTLKQMNTTDPSNTSCVIGPFLWTTTVACLLILPTVSKKYSFINTTCLSVQPPQRNIVHYKHNETTVNSNYMFIIHTYSQYIYN
ncbi:hypothetical protein BsWGS_14237 [Bradybaena similaris]